MLEDDINGAPSVHYFSLNQAITCMIMIIIIIIIMKQLHFVHAYKCAANINFCIPSNESIEQNIVTLNGFK